MGIIKKQTFTITKNTSLSTMNAKLILIVLFALFAFSMATKVTSQIKEDEEVVARGHCVNGCISTSLECQQGCPSKVDNPRFNCLNACYAAYRECKPTCD